MLTPWSWRRRWPDYRPAAVAADKVKKKGEMSTGPGTHPGYSGLGGGTPPTRKISSSADFPWRLGTYDRKLPAKLRKKHLDMIVANNLKVPGAGFGVDTNVVTLITAQGTESLPLQSKDAVATALPMPSLRPRPDPVVLNRSPFCIFPGRSHCRKGDFLCAE